MGTWGNQRRKLCPTGTLKGTRSKWNQLGPGRQEAGERMGVINVPSDPLHVSAGKCRIKIT